MIYMPLKEENNQMGAREEKVSSSTLPASLSTS